MSTTQSARKINLSPRTIVAAALTIVAAIFILQNRNSASLDLFWVSVQAPLWLTLVVVFAVGWAAGFLIARRNKKSA